MVLTKRKRNGEFVPWAPMGSQAESSSMGAIPEPARRRTRATTTKAKEAEAPTPQAALETQAPATRPAPKRARVTPKATTSTSSVQVAGSSSTQPAPPKRGRKKKNVESDPEKRGAQFKSHCPQNILDRVGRVRSQTFYMIDRNRAPGELRETFSVLGSTGNVYTVTIDQKPRCDCPDACRGNHCKHILFIFLKVLQVSETAGVWYQKALLSNELEMIFAEAPLAPNSVAHTHIREAHARATGKAITVADTSENNKHRIPGPDDDCPVCYDTMHGIAKKLLVFCEECGNALHDGCFKQWKTTAVNSGNQLTCVWCRAKWVAPNAPAGGSGGPIRLPGSRYINLAAVAGVSPRRDTSTYYHGPARGQSYHGYRDYED